MKLGYKLIAVLLQVSLSASAQIGIGNTQPNGLLDLNRENGKNNLGLVLPKGELSSFSTAVAGTIVYGTTDECVRVKGENSWG